MLKYCRLYNLNFKSFGKGKFLKQNKRYLLLLHKKCNTNNDNDYIYNKALKILKYLYRVQVAWTDDPLAANADYRSTVSSQDSFQAKGPLASLQGQSSR